MKLRVVIVDDEPLARERVRTFLAEEPDVEVVAECGDGTEAVKAIEARGPDLVFLDVQMPGLDGFEVLEALEGNALPGIVFTTAHDQHAVRAFEINAADYLLKPYNRERFRKALQRAREHLRGRTQPGPDRQLTALLALVRGNAGGDSRILVKTSNRILFLKPQEVDYVEAAGNYLLLHAGKERHMIRETMVAMEKRLAGAGFMRVSRSALVNLSRIREVQPLAGSEYCVILQSGARLDMTCSLRELQARLDRS
jgi:two-component system LytT family response regulator